MSVPNPNHEDLGKCHKCERTIPIELLAPMYSSAGNTEPVCGVCALEIQNEIHGVESTEFTGEFAELMRQNAIKHYEKTHQL